VLPLVPVSFWLAIAAGDYAGAEACRACHASTFQAQSATAHARALSPAKAGQPGEWAFGSGTQAITFVRRLNPEYYLEEGESWYRALDGYARTPGHTTTGGVRDRIFDPAATILRCFSCHSTGPLSISEDRRITPREQGVRCEACHGPAAAQSRDPARVRPRNPARLSADEINQLCGECHRMPMPDYDEISLRSPWNARHQPFLLAASKCFRESGRRLSCLTCHSPHQPLETKSEGYDAVCASCHATPRPRTAVAGRACVECHMPVVRPQAYLKFSNHRIAIYAASDPLAPVKRPQ
jgi:hypothetical protein